MALLALIKFLRFVLWSCNIRFYTEGENKDNWGKCYSVKHTNREWPKSSDLSLLPSADTDPAPALRVTVAVLLLTSSQGSWWVAAWSLRTSVICSLFCLFLLISLYLQYGFLIFKGHLSLAICNLIFTIRFTILIFIFSFTHTSVFFNRFIHHLFTSQIIFPTINIIQHLFLKSPFTLL